MSSVLEQLRKAIFRAALGAFIIFYVGLFASTIIFGRTDSILASSKHLAVIDLAERETLGGYRGTLERVRENHEIKHFRWWWSEYGVAAAYRYRMSLYRASYLAACLDAFSSTESEPSSLPIGVAFPTCAQQAMAEPEKRTLFDDFRVARTAVVDWVRAWRKLPLLGVEQGVSHWSETDSRKLQQPPTVPNDKVAGWHRLALSAHSISDELLMPFALACSGLGTMLLAQLVSLASWLRQRRQRQFFVKIRSLFLRGTQAFEAGDREYAQQCLGLMQGVESLRQSDFSRGGVIRARITTGVVAGVTLMALKGIIVYWGLLAGSEVLPSRDDAFFLGWIFCIGFVAGVSAPTFFGDAPNLRYEIADLCQRMTGLLAGRDIELASKRGRGHVRREKLADREMFGLGPTFSKADLRRAFAMQARDLHPDANTGETAQVKQYAENQMRVVNAAYARLKLQAA